MGLNVSYRHFGNRTAVAKDVRGARGTCEANSHGDLTRLKKGGTK